MYPVALEHFYFTFTLFLDIFKEITNSKKCVSRNNCEEFMILNLSFERNKCKFSFSIHFNCFLIYFVVKVITLESSQNLRPM